MIEGVIYRYKSPSGKYYIGQTMDEEGRRHMFLHNKLGYAGHRINEARKKYGPKNFEYTVLMKVIGDNPDEIRDCLNTLEIGFIRMYDSYNNGYNMSEGGHNMTEEAKKKMSKTKKGRIPWNKGLKGVQKGYWTGKKRSEETNEKIRKKLTGCHIPSDVRMKMSISQKGRLSPVKGKHRVYNPDGTYHYE